MNRKLIIPVLQEFSSAFFHAYDPFLLKEEERYFPPHENLDIDEWDKCWSTHKTGTGPK